MTESTVRPDADHRALRLLRRIIDVVGFAAAFKLCIATLLVGALLMALPMPRSRVAQ